MAGTGLSRGGPVHAKQVVTRRESTDLRKQGDDDTAERAGEKSVHRASGSVPKKKKKRRRNT